MVYLPHWPKILERRSYTGGLHKLEKFRYYLELLGNPHKKLPPTIHVAGTNGKGSTVAFIRSILEKAGLNVHVFTSPHFLRFNERIVISGSEIDDHYLYEILEECRIVAEKNNIRVTFFEGTTAAAFLAFARNKADAVILEVGLGGIWDATNVIEHPEVTVITSISLDHTYVLGNSLTEIAVNKAGIIKKNVPCVVSLQTPEVHEVIQNYADTLNAPIVSFEYDFGVSIENGLLSYKSKKLDLKMNPPSLLGYHQYVNAATAIAAVNELKSIKASAANIAEGIGTAQWKGRLERITSGKVYKMLSPGSELWLDSAHNDGGGQSIAAWLRDQTKMRTCLIFNMTHGRDPKKFLSFFEGLVDRIICVSIHSEPDSFKANELSALIGKDMHITSSCEEHVEHAIKCIKDTEGPVRLLIIGSQFLLSDFYKTYA